MLKSHIFREYDIRGIVDQDFDELGVKELGQAFATKVIRETSSNKIVLAYDGRHSSPDLADALTKGMLLAGADVINIGCGPTPLLYYGSHLEKAAGGVMITGSHNPPEYNGFKLVIDQKSINGQEIKNLYEMIEARDLLENSDSGGTESKNIMEQYIKILLDDFYANYPGVKPRVAWDPGNGATGEVVQSLLEQFEGEHYLINGEIDGDFPAHHPDPSIDENLNQLRDIVEIMNCDFGIAFDGDGDRIGVVDSHGNMITGEQLLALFAQEVLETNPGEIIIADVKTGQGVFDFIESLGGKPFMWKSGHSLIKQKMRELKSPFAGELSGHMFFADRYYGFDDAIYAALRLIGYVYKNNIDINTWFDRLPDNYSIPELQINLNGNDKFEVVAKVKQSLDLEGIKFNDVDGVRVSSKTGWWLLRASNTQEKLIVRAEASTSIDLENSMLAVKKYLGDAGIKNLFG